MTARVRQAVALLLVTISASIPLTPVLASPATGGIDGHVFDSTLTQVVGDRFAKVFSWYDNEWGFSNRMIDLVSIMAKSL